MKSLIKTKGDSKHINHRYNVTITRVASSFRNRVPVRGCTVHHQIGMDQILWEQLKCGYRKLFYDMRCATGTQVQTFLTASLRAGPQCQLRSNLQAHPVLQPSDTTLGAGKDGRGPVRSDGSSNRTTETTLTAPYRTDETAKGQWIRTTIAIGSSGSIRPCESNLYCVSYTFLFLFQVQKR